jgi:hypothetical protein
MTRSILVAALFGAACGGSSSTTHDDASSPDSSVSVDLLSATDLAGDDLAGVDLAHAGGDAAMASGWTGSPLYIAVGYDGVRAMSNDGVSFSTAAKGGTDGDGTNQDDQYNFRSIAYANGRFVAVGGGCLPPYSTCPARLEVLKSDLTWNVIWTPTNNAYNWLGGVASDGTHWVAVGGFGPIAYSADGDNWTYESGNKGNPLRAVAYGGGRFVAVGDNGQREYSTDGQKWTTANESTKNRYSSIAYGNGIFAAVGTNLLSCSTDGKTWTDPGTMTSGANNIAFGGGVFLINNGGASYSSTDCKTWTQVATKGAPDGAVSYATVKGKGTFYGLTWVDNLYTTPSGATWTKETVTQASGKTSALEQVASTE